MNKKYIRLMPVALLVSLIAVQQLYSRWKIAQQTHEATASYIPVETKIERAFPTGSGIHMGTVILTSYTHDGKKYIKTITRKGGYIEGKYKRGDVLTLYINPDSPEEIIENTSLKHNFIKGKQP